MLKLGLVVFFLGLRHGFDADHLAAIDGLTRFNSLSRSNIARFCGMLFSLGHGVVVLCMALLVGLLARQLALPSWLESFGDWVSVVFLILLGFLNLRAVASASRDSMVRPVGIKGEFFGRFAFAAHPFLVGALFAISFDTLSQAALFSLAASRFGGWENSWTMGLLFMLGMLVTDGLNGLWMSRLLNRADRAAFFASRTMGFAVAGVSLLTAAFCAARVASPAIGRWIEGREMIFGYGVIAMIAASFVFAMHAGRRAC